MAWIAEVLRRDHRVCCVCRMGPTHVYGEAPREGAGDSGDPDDAIGDPLCNGCLASRLEDDLQRFAGRALIFEPSLGPGGLVYREIEGPDAPAGDPAVHETARRAIASIRDACGGCGAPARYLWVPSTRDEGLWGGEWLAALQEGTLIPTASECGRCAARRLMASIEGRGLFFESIVPPAGADGVLWGDDGPSV